MNKHHINLKIHRPIYARLIPKIHEVYMTYILKKTRHKPFFFGVIFVFKCKISTRNISKIIFQKENFNFQLASVFFRD
jgi:hypothetical protein